MTTPPSNATGLNILEQLAKTRSNGSSIGATMGMRMARASDAMMRYQSSRLLAGTRSNAAATASRSC